MYSAFTLGVALWLVYGLSLGAWPVVVANTITLALALSILVMKLRYGRAPEPEKRSVHGSGASLKVALEVVARRCEDDIGVEVARFHKEARYDGARFRVPSFQDVGAIWIRSVSQQEKALKAEIARLFEVPNVVFSGREVEEAQRAVELLFSSERYTDRLVRFSEGVGRQAGRYGVQFSAADHGIDSFDAAYRAGIANAVREARDNVLAELHHRQRSLVPEAAVIFLKWKRFLGAHPLWAIPLLLALSLCFVVGELDLGRLFKSQ